MDNEPKHDPLSAEVESLERKEHTFTVGGYAVPNITGTLVDGENTWEILLDHRFGLELTHQELQRFLPFLADAMAVAAGYSAHGANSVRLNPYKRAVFKIGE